MTEQVRPVKVFYANAVGRIAEHVAREMILAGQATVVHMEDGSLAVDARGHCEPEDRVAVWWNGELRKGMHRPGEVRS